jgi:predicted phosphoserine aminotransferase
MQEKPPQQLFIPGPTDVLPDVLAAQTAPMVGHRSDEFETLFASTQEKLRRLFGTDQRVFVSASSGSGMLEAAIRNCVRDRVLCTVCGAFGKRWFQIAEASGKTAIELAVPYNSAVKPEQVRDALGKALADGPVDAVTVTHNETSTGVLNPVAEITEAVNGVSPDTLVLVDAVSSLAGTPVPVDEWALDVCVTSSQKAMALPPGLAFAAVRDRALARAAETEGRGWYFDFVNLEKYLQRNTTPATPAISLMRALDVQLDHILYEGLDRRYERHSALAGRVQQWATERGFSLAAEAGFRSPTVTNITNTHDLDIGDVNRFLSERSLTLSDGYGPFKGKSFRIAHMGEVDETDIERLLAALDEYLAAKAA